MLRKIVSILALLCFLAISNSAIAAQLNWAGTDANWFNAANWGGVVPTPNDWAAIQPGYTQPIIDGDAACSPLDIEPWSGGGLSSVDMDSGTLDFGSSLNCATWGSFDTSAPGFSPGILYVHGGTITTQSAGSSGLVVGSPYGPSVGRVIMYDGLLSVPRITLNDGDITLYGGTLELKNSADDANADANFVFSQMFSGNKIDVSGGTLSLAGDHMTTDPCLPALIAAGYIYSSRGTLGTPAFDGTWTTLVSSDVNMLRAYNPSPANGATNIRYKTNPYDANDPCSITLFWSKGDCDTNVTDQYVYFGTSSAALVYQGTRYHGSPDAVDPCAPNHLIAWTDPCNWTIKEPNQFAVGANYYWRINEVNLITGAVATGKVWTFKTHDGKAFNPNPANASAGGLNANLLLSWTPGDWTDGTNGHKVYFSTSSGLAIRPTDKQYRGQQDSNTYSLTKLAGDWTIVPGTTYYWAVDEVVNGVVAYKGPTWSFTAAAYLNIDDFEDYQNTDDVNANWPNGYTLTGCPDCQGYAGRLLVQDSSGKYMRYSYNNNAQMQPNYGGTPMAFSEAKHPYSGSGTSFIGGGVISPAPKALRIDYKGAATNTANMPNFKDEGDMCDMDRMYVAIEDATGHVSMYLNPDPYAQQVGNWTSWYVSLYDINAWGNTNLNAITGFAIGFGERCVTKDNGSDAVDANSFVMFDNIRLYAQTCNPGYAHTTGGLTADLDNDCDVDINDLYLLANDWLTHADNIVFSPYTAPHKAPILWYKFTNANGADTNQYPADYGTGDPNNYTGTINAFTAQSWKVGGGRDGNNCLYLPSGGNSYVSCPTSALSFMSDANHSAPDGGGITFSTWMNADVMASEFQNWGTFIIIGNALNTEATSIACPYHNFGTWGWVGWWKSESPTWSWGPSAPLADFGGRWNHWAFVKEPHAISFYCNGTLVGHEADTDSNQSGGLDQHIYGPLFTPPATSFAIGTRWWAYWAGRIADFQVYDYALSPAEVAYLATDGTGHIILPLVSPANLNTDGVALPTKDPNQIVDFRDLAIMGKQWHTQILWP